MLIQVSRLQPSKSHDFVAAFASVVCVCLLFSGCRGEYRLRRTLARVQHEQLRRDAAAVYARFGGAGVCEIPEASWPASFSPFRPRSVWIDQHGVYVCTQTRFVETAGLFVRVDPSFEPPRRGDPGFNRIEGDFFWFLAPG